MAHCPISATKAILQEYLASPEGSAERKRMEGRYGRSTLQKLVDENESERAFQEWLERSTGTPCPGCELRVEKHSGCNHVRIRSVTVEAQRTETCATDDVHQVQTTLLLPLRGEAGSHASIQAFLDAGAAVFFEAV